MLGKASARNGRSHATRAQKSLKCFPRHSAGLRALSVTQAVIITSTATNVSVYLNNNYYRIASSDEDSTGLSSLKSHGQVLKFIVFPTAYVCIKTTLNYKGCTTSTFETK